MHIIRAAIASLRNERKQEGQSPPEDQAPPPDLGDLGDVHTFFFSQPDDFPQVVSFVHEADTMYKLRMRVIEGDFKSGLERFVADTGIQAIFIGTRR